MSKFGHLKKLDIESTKLVPYEIIQIADKPVLQVAPATEVNKPFFNALLRRARKTSKAVQAGAITAGLIDSNREEDKELYSQFVVKGWSNVKDESGNDVPFSQADCLEYLKALPNYIFDPLREFVSNPMNFVEDTLDVDTAAKN